MVLKVILYSYFFLRLCQERDVKHAVITRSAKNPNDVLVIGPNVSSIQKEIKAIENKFLSQKFNVIVEDNVNPVKRVTSSLVVEKLRGANGDWQKIRKAKCEFLVLAEEQDKYPDNHHPHGAVFAVVPAHFVFSRSQTRLANEALKLSRDHNMAKNREVEQVDSRDCDHHPSVMAFYHLRDHQLNARANEVMFDIEKENEDTREIAKARKMCESTISNQRYSALETGDQEMKRQPIDFNHPMLICFRQIIYNSSFHDPHCPIRNCLLDQNTSCCHMFMNDLALIPMNYDDATRLQKALEAEENSVFGVEKKIRSITKLESLHAQERTIRVGDAEGQMLESTVLLQDNKTFAKRVTFVLPNQ